MRISPFEQERIVYSTHWKSSDKQVEKRNLQSSLRANPSCKQTFCVAFAGSNAFSMPPSGNIDEMLVEAGNFLDGQVGLFKFCRQTRFLRLE